VPLAGLPDDDGRDERAEQILVCLSNLAVCDDLNGRASVVDAEAEPTRQLAADGQLPEDERVPHVECAGAGSAILFSGAGVADFLIDQDGLSVTVAPQAACSGPALNHWLIDQVLPRVLAHRGRLVIHGAAVHPTSDSAIAFLGDTGAGKSTLTASLHEAGYGLVSDDAVVLDAGPEDSVTAMSTYPSLRLWPDAIAELYGTPPPVAPMARDSTKRRVLIENRGAPAQQPVPLAAIYLLERTSNATSHRVSLRPLSGREACMAIINNAFQLDLTDTQRAARLMTAAAAVARRVPVFALAYPSDFNILPDVCAAVIEQSRGGVKS